MKISISFLSDVEDLYEDFLKELGVSKSQFKKSGLKKGLRFKRKDECSIPCDLLRSGEINPIYSGPAIKILFEDDEFLAVSKPPNVHGHPLSFSETDTVLNFLEANSKSSSFGGTERGLLYRLDGETSGILVLAKKETIHTKIRDDFTKFSKEKIYLAIVEGKIDETGEVTHLLEAAGEKGSLQKISENGKLARLNILKVTYNSEHDLSLVQILLETGHRHQIRAQLAGLGHSILGDTKYGGKAAKRLYLHALKYSFEYEGGIKTFTDNEPLLFNQFFDLNSCL